VKRSLVVAGYTGYNSVAAWWVPAVTWNVSVIQQVQISQFNQSNLNE